MSIVHRTVIVPFVRYSYTSLFAKERRDLETGGRGRSRSLKMAPFDRSYTTFYWSAVVSIAVCCTIFKYLTLSRPNRYLENVTEGHSSCDDSKAWV